MITAAMIEEAASVEPDRTLATSFAPNQQAREGLISLILFNHEIARVADVVSDPAIGHIRLHWWREVGDQIFTASPVRRHPVAEALATTVTAYNLPRTLLDQMIDARELALATIPFETAEARNSWADHAFGNLIRLGFLVCGAPTLSQAHETAAAACGELTGTTVLLASLNSWRARGACWLTPEEQVAAGVRMVDGAPVWPNGEEPKFRKALKAQVSTIAMARKTANHALRQLDADQLAALVYATLLPTVARQTSQSTDPFTTPLSPPLLLRQMRLVWATAVKRI